MRIILTNLSNELYEESRIRLNKSAEKHGIIEINSYDFADITITKFYSENKKILDSPKGIGYWLWKPFIILETMKRLEEGDIVIYSDCGIEIISDLKPLINICKVKEPVLLFANGNFPNSLWTKKDCFYLMDCDTEEARISRHCDAAFALFRKCDVTIDFLSDWLSYGTNENIISDLPNVYGENSFDYIDHRWDQSILSLLAYKRNIELYRMPTQFGNHYKLPAYRVNGEINCVNQLDRIPTIDYSNEPYENSCYFQLLNHHRDKKNHMKLQLKKIKTV